LIEVARGDCVELVRGLVDGVVGFEAKALRTVAKAPGKAGGIIHHKPAPSYPPERRQHPVVLDTHVSPDKHHERHHRLEPSRHKPGRDRPTHRDTDRISVVL
jgi:hypothetical protein